MRYILSTIPLLFCLFSFQSMAVSVYECVDEAGNSTYQDSCPPGTKPVNEKKYGKKPKAATQNTDISATLYSTPECEPCDEVREFFQLRNIPVTDKNVNDDIDLQNELKEIAGGELRVPVTVVGESTIKGYRRTELLSALEAVGYIEPSEEKEKNTE